ncbi:MAG: hypothetical protein QM647_12345 [Asticcacaulis sp.]|uniref:hypothetical protein n=1 Tax=Asticcacaulis sp. TaxID=1872648 RepID=UPI0039E67BAC
MSRYLASTALLGLLAVVACSPQKPAETPAASEAASEEAVVSSLAPADYTSLANVMTCDWPVKKTDTAESLLAIYKSYAQVADIPGAEGITQKGVVIYGNDPRRRVEVFFFDDALTQVSTVLIRGDSQWSGPKGLHLNSTLADIAAANEKPFKLGGFGWDYGGYVTDLNRGRLAKVKGGCTFGLRLGLPENGGPAPEAILGERTLLSTDSAVIAANPVVQEMSVGWPKPKAETDEDVDQ